MVTGTGAIPHRVVIIVERVEEVGGVAGDDVEVAALRQEDGQVDGGGGALGEGPLPARLEGLVQLRRLGLRGGAGRAVVDPAGAAAGVILLFRFVGELVQGVGAPAARAIDSGLLGRGIRVAEIVAKVGRERAVQVGLEGAEEPLVGQPGLFEQDLLIDEVRALDLIKGVQGELVQERFIAEEAEEEVPGREEGIDVAAIEADMPEDLVGQLLECGQVYRLE